MKKIIPILLGLMPTVITFSNNILDSAVRVDYKNSNDTTDDGVDDWSEKYITIDFSTVKTVQSSSFETFDLEIEKIIKISKNGKRDVVINWRYFLDGKWGKMYKETEKWTHKGFWIGEMISDILKDNQKIIFKNLVKGKRFDYDIVQPDAMLAQLFMFVFKLEFSTITVNYTNPNWFVKITSIGGGSLSHDESLAFRKLSKTRYGRHKLNLDYFSKYQADERDIMTDCLGFIMLSTIFSEYDLEELWNSNFINF
jgi:hypothetical protein